MEERPLPPAPSVSDSLVNVISSPATAFDDLHNKASAPALWVVPFFAGIVFIILFMYVQFNVSPFREQMQDVQRAAIQKMVNEGRLTQAQADMASEGLSKAGGIQMAIGLVAAIVVMAVFFFLGALVLWLAAKFALQSPAGYGKVLEFYGISGWIGLVGSIITILLMFALGSMHARPAASLAILSSFNPMDTTHKILAAIDIFAIWQTAVIGIGLAKFSGKSVGVGMAIAFGLWIVWIAGRVALGLGG